MRAARLGRQEPEVSGHVRPIQTQYFTGSRGISVDGKTHPRRRRRSAMRSARDESTKPASRPKGNNTPEIATYLYVLPERSFLVNLASGLGLLALDSSRC